MRVTPRAVLTSFQMAKEDIVQLQEQVLYLTERQELMAQEIWNLKQKKQSKPKAVKKKAKPKRTTRTTGAKPDKFVASKFGKSFYAVDAPQAKKITTKNKVFFKTARKALNAGYKPGANTRNF